MNLERAARLATEMPERDRKVILANEPDLAQLDPEEAARHPAFPFTRRPPESPD